MVSAHRQKLRTRSREGNGDDGVADDDQERLGELPFDVRDRRVDLDGTGVMRFIQEVSAAQVQISLSRVDLYETPISILVLSSTRISAAELVLIRVQEGAIIFVPSGWYHQVVNLDFVRPWLLPFELRRLHLQNLPS